MACSRRMCMKKMEMVLLYCEKYGMDINLKKTSFSVINKSPSDCEPLVLNGISIPYKDNYCYLGSFFTDDGKTSSAIKKHIESKMSDIY